MITATNIHYEHADRLRGLSAGGIGAILLMAHKIELVKGIDRTLQGRFILRLALTGFPVSRRGGRRNVAWLPRRSCSPAG